MTQTIYIAIVSGGKYDDAWQSNSHAFFEKTDAELYIESQKALK